MTANHIMIDFESIGKAINGKMAFVGFTKFNPYELNSHEELMDQVMEVKLNWAHEDQADFKYDKGILDFWTNQPLEIRKRMLDEPETGVCIIEFCNIFEDYLHSCGFNGARDIVWARGTNFDITILERFYSTAERELPFPWWRARDVRTFIDAANVVTNQTNKQGSNFIGKMVHINDQVSNHDAKFDIANDIVNVQRVMKILMEFQKQS